MATKSKTIQPAQQITVRAASDLPARRFINAKGELCSETGLPIGVTEIAWSLGNTAAIISLGTALIDCAEPINIGDKLAPAASGYCKKWTSGADWCATAMSSAGSGATVKAKLTC
jgi:hypothetical protein